MLKLLLFLFSIGLFPFCYVGQTNVLGDWFGFLKVNNSELKLVYHIKKNNKGELTGTMDSPSQGAYGLNLNKVIHVKDSVTFDLSIFGINYKGKFTSKDTIEGIFTQGQFSDKMKLVRSEVELETKPKRPQEALSLIYYKTKEIEFFNKKSNIKLSGTLTIPRGKGPFPAVILVSGSGPQNRNEELLGHKPFLVLADYLTRRGIAVLRYDDRGVGKSEGVFSSATTADFAFDAQAAFLYLSEQNFVKKNRVGIIGHSEGGMIAQMIAASDSAVKFIVLLAGPGVPISQLMLKQTEYMSRFSGVSEQEIQISLELNKKFYDILNNEPNDSLAKRKIENIVNDHTKSMPSEIAEQIEKDLPTMTESMLSPWFRYFINFNPEHYLRQINCPVLAINGAKDMQVSAIENLNGIRSNIKETNNKNVYTYIMPDLNHLMQHCKTGNVNEYIQIEETISEEVMQIVAKWIRKFELIH